MTFFGLSEKDAEASRKKYGLNELLYRPSLGKNILRGLGGLSCKLFAIAALADIIASLLGMLQYADIAADFVRPAVLILMAVLCGLAETFLRYRSEKLLNGICGSAKDGMYTVFRDNGKTESVPGNMLAAGDAVMLSVGDRIPADGKVAEGQMTVDQSVFGVLGKAEKTAPPQGANSSGRAMGVNDPYFVYGGSAVCGGSGIVRITAVGKDMRIAERTGVKPMELRGDGFEKTVFAGGFAGVAASLAVLCYYTVGGIMSGGLIGGAAHGISCAAAVLAVSCFCGKNLICESAAAGAVKRLAKKGAKVSRPDILEAAADTGLALVGKAGIVAGAEGTVTFIDGNGKEYSDFGKTDKRLAELLKRSVACTSAAVTASDSVCGGNALDRSLYAFIGKGMDNVPEMKKQAEVKSEAENILSGTTVSVDGKLFTFVRGGAEIMLERCTDSFGGNGKKQKITNKSALIKLAETLSLTGGKDVTAFAVSNRGISGGRLPSSGYTLIGLAALHLSSFDDTAEEIKRLEKLGVRTMLVTSESRESAVYDVKNLGIRKSGGMIVTSEQLAKMSDEELASKLKDINAVARAVPSDRRRLIRAAHSRDMKVCVTVSDIGTAKAVKEADLTVASPHCETAALQYSDAAAEKRGIKAIADIVSSSVRYGLACRTRIIIRAVCAVIAALIFFRI